MATRMTYSDSEFLFRLQTEIIDGGTDVLRNIFDQKLPNTPLNIFLVNEKASIKRLRAQKTITKTQYDLLYHPGAQPPNSADFDITLIICLLRNLKSLGLNSKYSWNVPPQPTDTSLEADLCRLKGFRNEIAHISTTIGFQKASFLTKWTDIEQVLLRLNSVVPNPVPDLKKALDSYKHSPLEPAAEQRIQADIENWREMEKALEAEMKLIKEDVKGLLKDVKGVSEDVKEGFKKVNDNIESISDDIGKSKEKDVKEPKEANPQDLQDDLISFYRDQHRTISLSPLIAEDTSLLEFYVMPDIHSLKVQRTRNGVKEVKTAVTPLRNMFYNDNKMCRKIYLTADAGLGKTALSRRLTLAWCHANKSHEDEAQYFSQEEIKAVNGFRFVFLLLLRDGSYECDIDVFIMNQIISRLGRPYTREFLENILFKERCLVILDGLDEWSHPSNSCKQGWSPIPHRKVRERTAVLTTTRPWKLSVSALKSSQIDQKLEITGLNRASANSLKKTVISNMFDEKDENKLIAHVTDFTRAVQEKQIADLEAIPLLLMYLLFLWCNKIELGISQCDLYSQITELLLSRTLQDYDEISPKVDLPKDDIPQCFSEKLHCTQYYTLLTALGQLAYQTLFRETREENTLVFDGSVAKQYLNEECMNLCLKTGLITQRKVPGTLLEQKSKVSFAHKTVQEFFAVLYMHSDSDQTSLPEIVLSKCKCIKDILEMSKILKFGCGMNVNVSFLISRKMMKIINEAEITCEYRSSLECSTSEYGFSQPLKDFQDMCISCCKEIPRENKVSPPLQGVFMCISCCKEVPRANEVSLCLQDVFIERSCKQERYRDNLKQLMTKNKQNIRSLYIDMYDMRDTPYRSTQEVIEYFALNDLENIEKIHYEDGYIDNDILPQINNSVKCLYLSCSRRRSWSRLPCEKVTSLQKLEAIHIGWYLMSHSELTLLYEYISQRHRMRHIDLEVLRCTDHWESCTGCSLDMSQHSQLNKLTLYRIRVSVLNINMASLEKCCLDDLPNPDLLLRFINCVPAASKLNTFECRRLKSPVAIETMLETLRLSVHVKHVELFGINLGYEEVLSSEMVNIERVELREVTMTASVVQGIVDVVQQQPQTVTVHIRGCDIKPESEFVTVKQKIKTSRGHFRVLGDSWRWFEFETIKQGD